MDTIDFNNIKFKPLDESKIIISVDRLTRFKETEEKYLRVFRDILISNLIYPKYKKSDLESMEYSKLTYLAEYIINESLKILLEDYEESDFYINYLLQTFENSVFNVSDKVSVLLDNKINYNAVIKLLDDNVPINLKWLKMLLTSNEPITDSYKMGLKYPIKKIVLCEGITEEILLPEFAKLVGYDFNMNGVQLISAGGKNQVVKMFYDLAEKVKVPIFVLMDSDASKNKEEIIPKARSKDRIYILKNGEFEDNLPLHLVEKALKYSIANISEEPEKEEEEKSEGMVNYLEHFYKNRGAHEFKKADFAHVVQQNISGIEDVSDVFKTVINEIEKM